MRPHFLFSITLCVLLAACQQPATKRPSVTAQERQAEEEYQRQMLEEAARSGGSPRPWRNREKMGKQFERVAGRIEAAGAKLCQDLGLPRLNRRCYYYFDTNRSLEINAYADGKYIVINRGLQRFVENDNELAVVMGHELAHNLMGHIEATGQNVTSAYVVGAVLDGIVASQGGATNMASLSMETAMRAYSPDFEAEADYVGLYIAARAGYDIKAAPRFWRRKSLEEPEGIYNGGTHPSNAERFVALQKTIEEIKLKKSRREPLLPEMQGRVIQGDYQAEKNLW